MGAIASIGIWTDIEFYVVWWYSRNIMVYNKKCADAIADITMLL
jgi:hypothetical protein